MVSGAVARTGWAADVTPPEKSKERGQMGAREKGNDMKSRVLKTMRTFTKEEGHMEL